MDKQYGVDASSSKAEFMLPQITTFSTVAKSKLPDRVSMTFKRPGNGLNLAGKLSHDFLPIITAFFLAGSDVVRVTLLKNLRSPGSFHGKSPSFPMPMSRVAAITTW
jgi:hypothetical protein